jgi:hypothetical protein
MTIKSKLTIIAALAALSIASPAFAQSQSHDGSLLPHYFNGEGEIVWGAWGPPAPAAADHRVARAPAVVPHQIAHAGDSRVARAPTTARERVAHVGNNRVARAPATPRELVAHAGGNNRVARAPAAGAHQIAHVGKHRQVVGLV